MDDRYRRVVGHGLVERARSVAGELLAHLPDRWLHTHGVARRAGELAPLLAPPDRPLLVAAAWVHDIGYSPRICDTGFHPLDGARYLERQGFPRLLVCLVAHHSGAAYTAREYHLDEDLAGYDRPDGPVLDALVAADMTTGPQGQPMSFDHRVAEALRRHGPDSVYARVLPRRHPYLAAAVARTRARVRDADARLQPAHPTLR